MYNMTDYNKFWGPCAWKTIHSYAASFVPTCENKKAFINFINSQIKLLPCEKCRAHFLKNLKEINIENYLNSNDDLFLWTYFLHDRVNKSLNKKSPPYDQIKKIYFNNLGKKCDECKV